MTEMEMDVLKHRAGLSADQIAENERRSAKPENPQQINAQFFGPGDVDSIPMLFGQNAVQLPTVQEEKTLCEKHKQEMLREIKYGDPALGLQKNIERIVVQHDDINDRTELRNQYKQQVFQPHFELPTMTLEEFADMEVEDALDRQKKQEEMEKMIEEQESDDEDVLEEKR